MRSSRSYSRDIFIDFPGISTKLSKQRVDVLADHDLDGRVFDDLLVLTVKNVFQYIFDTLISLQVGAFRQQERQVAFFQIFDVLLRYAATYYLNAGDAVMLQIAGEDIRPGVEEHGAADVVFPGEEPVELFPALLDVLGILVGVKIPVFTRYGIEILEDSGLAHDRLQRTFVP